MGLQKKASFGHALQRKKKGSVRGGNVQSSSGQDLYFIFERVAKSTGKQPTLSKGAK